MHNVMCGIGYFVYKIEQAKLKLLESVHSVYFISKQALERKKKARGLIE